MSTLIQRWALKPWALLGRWRALAAGWGQCRHLNLRDTYSLAAGKVRVPFEGFPIQIVLGPEEKRLHLYPETLIGDDEEGKGPPRFLIVDPERYFTEITGFLRLEAGERITLGRADDHQMAIFTYPDGVAAHHLLVMHEGDAIVFRNLSRARTCIAPLLNDAKSSRIEKLRRLLHIYGGPIEPLGPAEALDLIEQVNALMAQECFRPRDHRGLPGGLIRIPDDITPILVADLHAQVDNLLTVLSQNAFLEGLEAGTACLILLGDAVHSETDDELEAMETSMLIMDLIFRLKVRFPERLFFLRGNHDAFAEDIAKGGVPQGLLWARALVETRGQPYLQAMERFYGQLPYVACSSHFLAAHAAPPRTKISPEILVQIHRYPGLIPELIANRLQRPNRPQGYTAGDIRRFRKALGLEPATPFVVGHTPMDRSETLWMDVGGVANHHVLFSANPDQVGVFTEIGGALVPLRYRVEPLRGILNETLTPAEAIPVEPPIRTDTPSPSRWIAASSA